MNCVLRTAAFPVFLSLLLASGSSYAASDGDDIKALTAALTEQSARIKAQQEALILQQQKIDNEYGELNALKAKLEKITGKTVTMAGPATPGKSIDATPPAEVGTERKPVQPEHPPEIAKYIEEGSVLLPKGKLVVTPSLEYDRSSATNVAIEGLSIIPAVNIGIFDVSQVNRDTLMGAIDARLGITNRIEIEGKIPYLYTDQSTLGRPVGVGSTADSLTSINGSGLGDIEVGAHYQINKGQNNWPYLIGNLRFKSITGEGPFEIPVNNFGLQNRLPTGSGFYALQPSITAIYPVDPVVFYSNVGYVHNFERSFEQYGTIRPGDSVSASFGMSTSVNDATSLSLGYSHSMVFQTKENGQDLAGSRDLQVGSLDFGWAYTINDRVSLNLNVSAGVTSDAPDDRVILRVPIAFDAF